MITNEHLFNFKREHKFSCFVCHKPNTALGYTDIEGEWYAVSKCINKKNFNIASANKFISRSSSIVFCVNCYKTIAGEYWEIESPII